MLKINKQFLAKIGKNNKFWLPVLLIAKLVIQNQIHN